MSCPGCSCSRLGSGKRLLFKLYQQAWREPDLERLLEEGVARVEARVVDEAGGGDETRVDAVERKLKEQFRAAHGHI